MKPANATLTDAARLVIIGVIGAMGVALIEIPAGFEADFL